MDRSSCLNLRHIPGRNIGRCDYVAADTNGPSEQEGSRQRSEWTMPVDIRGSPGFTVLSVKKTSCPFTIISVKASS